ncbi:MAG: FtsH protease activity modulator HflK [Alphaproteobacteria bacterium]|nr:FtsH protease activity modulator HflK [Alphaproteobacteria bacterium]
MPWQSQGGGGGPWGSGGGGGQNPWGRGGGGGGIQPPDLEDLIRKGQDRFRRMMPGGAASPRAIMLIVLAAAIVWLASGFYRVQPDELGVPLIFGRWTGAYAQPGLNYNLPAPVGSVERPKVTRLNRVEVGFRTGVVQGRGEAKRDITQESLMLTGDENIIDIQFVVFWQIKDAKLFLFNIRNPDNAVKSAAEAAMREIVGRSNFEFARTQGRGRIQEDAKKLIQLVLDMYGSGMIVTQVEIQKVDPPAKVIDAFRDVQAARADKERAVNDAQGYFNEQTQRAEGESEKILRGAEGFKEARIAEATGAAQRFLSIFSQYKEAKDITMRRMYLETMEELLGSMDKVIIEQGGGSSGVVPYLPLQDLTKRKAPPAQGGTQ